MFLKSYETPIEIAMLIGKFRLCTQKKKLSGDNFLSDIPLN
jgi:hypothetical protein